MEGGDGKWEQVMSRLDTETEEKVSVLPQLSVLALKIKSEWEANATPVEAWQYTEVLAPRSLENSIRERLPRRKARNGVLSWQEARQRVGAVCCLLLRL